MRKAIGIFLCALLLMLEGCGTRVVMQKERTEAMEVVEMTTRRTAERLNKNLEIHASMAGRLKAAEELEQLIIVEAHSEEGITATVTMHEKQKGIWSETLRVDGYLGYGGIGKEREGDGKTPTGLYGLSVAFGKKEDPGSLIPYTQIDEKYWWVGDYDSKYFNQLCHEDMEGRDWKLDPSESEHLWDYKGYNYCLFVEYNTEGVYKKGSCIFLHCIGQKLETLGCIAVAEEDMVFILQHLREGAKILIDTAENLASY